MKSLPRLALLFVMVATVFFSSSTRTSAQSSEIAAEYVPNEIVVTLHPGHTLTASGSLLNGQGRALLQRLHPGLLSLDLLADSADVALLKMAPGGDMQAHLEALRGNPAVRSADPNYVRTSLVNPNDQYFADQWGMRSIEAPAAWDITVGSNAVMIAMIDTGVSVSHPEFQGKIVGGYNAFNGGGNANDDEGHGTHTAGIAAAVSNNGAGVSGVCWNCTILPIKVLDRLGRGSSASIIRGIRYAADAGARIANMSLGGPEFTRGEQDAVDYAYNKGMLIIAASGNSGDRGNPTIYPAAFEKVLAVGAMAPNEQIARFSSYGPYVDVSAPGAGVVSTIVIDGRNTYASANGTSMAAPHVAGLAGLILSAWPELNLEQLRQIIMATAEDRGDPGKDDRHGYGRINARRALEAARDRQIPRLPGQNNLNPAFARVEFNGDPNATYFPETGHTLRGIFRDYWHQNGGLPVFGYAISEEFVEQTAEGQFLVQYFERERFELHLEKQPPYHVLLGRLGDAVLLEQGRNWFTFPRGQETGGCRWFGETGHSLCEPFLSYWRNHGLQFDSDPGVSESEAIALFGAPLSEPTMETNRSGDTVLTQWFERARLELHPNQAPEFQVQLGLLANELADMRGWR